MIFFFRTMVFHFLLPFFVPSFWEQVVPRLLSPFLRVFTVMSWELGDFYAIDFCLLLLEAACLGMLGHKFCFGTGRTPSLRRFKFLFCIDVSVRILCY